MAPNLSNSNNVPSVNSTGNVTGNNANNTIAVRQVLYLKTNVGIIADSTHTGTYNQPFGLS